MISKDKLKISLILPRKLLNFSIILATLAAAVYYISKHHYLLTDLKNIPIYIIAIIFLLYVVMLGVLVIIFDATMRLVNTKISTKDNFLINIYSLFMNFFVPGQTGPIFRGYYMKKNYGLKYINYTVATLIYYLIYGVISLLFITIGSQPFYFSLPIITGVIASAVLFVYLYLRKKNQAKINLNYKTVSYIVLATLAQVFLQTLIYFVELHSVNKGVRFSNVITYTGIANLALFAALTPGAIGIREAFLIFTQHLNHITTASIVLANIIDRSVYILFLLSLGVAIFGLKVREKLNIAKPTDNSIEI